MTVARQGPAEVLLPNGKVLVAGGFSGGGIYQDTAELYDPQTGTFLPTGSMTEKRYNIGLSSVLLNNGKVLIVGGSNSAGYLSSSEIYTPVASTYRIPDTGQSKCYNATIEIPCPQPGQAFYGQDAQYNGPQHSYTKLGANDVDLPDTATLADGWLATRDNVTGLIWEMKTDDGTIHDKDNTYTWCDPDPNTNGGNAGTCGNGTDTADFIAALNTANYSGHADWRLPTVKELSFLMNSSIPKPGPTIDQTWFPNMVSSLFWSSNTSAKEARNAWCADFLSVYVYNYSKSSSYYVRAVRGGQMPENGLEDNNDGTVSDTGSGLMWQQATAPGTYTWQQALAYVESLNLAGHDDWRLPNRNELQSLVDYHQINPAIDITVFPDTESSMYWSSTTGAGSTRIGWYTHFNDGNVDGNAKDVSYYVRAVRGGQPSPQPATASTSTFTDDFSASNLDKYLVVQNDTRVAPNWRVENGKLIQDAGADHHFLLVKDKQAATQVVETDLSLSAGAGYGGVVVWYHDINNWVSVYMYTNVNQVYVYSKINGIFAATSYPVTSLSNTLYHFKVDADSVTGTISVFVNDSLKVTHTVNSIYRTGLSGLTCGNGGATFDNLSITPIYRLPDTGQTQSYTNTFGEDHDYSINPPSYTSNNGTVTDNNTGLMWQQQNAGQGNWSQAVAMCPTQTTGGYTDWRLPSKNELVGVVDFSRYTPDAAINPIFTGIASSYWSSTPYVGTANYAMAVLFGDGLVNYYPNSSSYNVRCVRGAQASGNNYTASNGTVTDHSTGLVWQQQDDGQHRTWEGAIAYCEGLSLDNQADWRLPNVKELESITDDSRVFPAIDPIFTGVSEWDYWTSTTYAGSSSQEWLVNFSNGTNGYYNKAYSYVGNDPSNGFHVRCVSGGTSPSVTASTCATIHASNPSAPSGTQSESSINPA